MATEPTPDLRAAPLSPDELAHLRALYAVAKNNGKGWDGDWIGRLLATLDFERAATPSEPDGAQGEGQPCRGKAGVRHRNSTEQLNCPHCAAPAAPDSTDPFTFEGDSPSDVEVLRAIVASQAAELAILRRSVSADSTAGLRRPEQPWAWGACVHCGDPDAHEADRVRHEEHDEPEMCDERCMPFLSASPAEEEPRMGRASAWHEGHILGGYQNTACNECRREQRGPMTTEEFAAVDPVPRPPVDPRTADVERAIAIVEDSRSTHVHWRDWRRAGHGTDEDHEMVGDLAHHEEAIADYDHVLSVLRRYRAAFSSEDPLRVAAQAAVDAQRWNDRPPTPEMIRLRDALRGLGLSA